MRSPGMANGVVKHRRLEEEPSVVLGGLLGPPRRGRGRAVGGRIARRRNRVGVGYEIICVVGVNE